MVWTYKYYYSGYASWNWFYKYNHPPFISDVPDNLELIEVHFEGSQPLKPLEFRLMLSL